MRQPRYSEEEHARRGTQLYEERIRPRLPEGSEGKIVAIDVDTGAFEIADDALTASERLFAVHPAAQPWFVRVGHRAVHRLGGHGARRTA
jgi:hypothetical protein